MVAFANTFESKTPLRVRAHRHSCILGASPCLNSNNQANLCKVVYDECNRLESCSKDPIGYVDGENLFEYTGSHPIGHVDPSGNESLHPDNNRCYACCCCPVSVTITHGMDKATLGITWQALGWVNYAVKIKFFTIRNPSGFKRGENTCSLDFWEYPMAGSGMNPEYTGGTWNDAVDLVPDSPFFDPWESFMHPPHYVDPRTGVRMTDCEKRNRPNTVVLNLKDYPGSRNNRGAAFVHFYSALRISGGAKCKCKPPKVVRVFTGYLNALGWRGPLTNNNVPLPIGPPVGMPPW